METFMLFMNVPNVRLSPLDRRTGLKMFADVENQIILILTVVWK